MQEQVPQKRNYILIALMMTMMLAAMDTTIVSTAIPQIVSELGGFKRFSWVFSIYLLAQTVTIPLYGKLADIFGRKKILITGIVIFLIGSAASGCAWDIGSLIVFRGVQGLGAGSIMASVNTIAGDIYTLEERAKIQGWLSSIWGVSAILGPAIGGALAEYVNWRWIFFINIPVGILSMVFLMVYFKEKVEAAHPRIDYKGAVFILLTIGSLIIYLLEAGQSFPWIGIWSFAFIMAIIILVIVTIRIEKRAAEPILPAWVWRNRTLAFTNLAMIFMGIVMMGPETFLPTFAQASLGLGIIASGFVLASMSIGWPTASALSGKLYLRIGFRNTAWIGTGLIVLACAGFLWIPWPQPVYLIVLDQVLLGAGFGLLSTPSLVGVQSMVDWNRRGVVTGLNVFCRNLGQSLGAAIFGAIFNNSFRHQMERAPIQFSESTTDILQVLKSPDIAAAKKVFLEKAISNATWHIYAGLTIFALCAFWTIWKVPANPFWRKRPLVPSNHSF